MKYLMLLTILFVASEVHAVDLGPVKIYHSYNNDPDVKLVLVRLGSQEDKKILASFHVDGNAIDGQYAVYAGQCQTTKCEKIHYKVVGGTKTNIISDSGYFGNYFNVLLSGYNKPIPVSYDKKASVAASNKAVYEAYLAFVGRNKEGNFNAEEVRLSFSTALNNFKENCKSRAVIQGNIPTFKEKKLAYLVGMGRYHINQISAACMDEDYREELGTIKTIKFFPVDAYKKMERKDDELTIYLSTQNFNPQAEAQAWLDSL